MIEGNEPPHTKDEKMRSSQVMSPSEELGAGTDNKKQVQSEDAKAPKSTKTVAASDGLKKKASISESSTQNASNLTQEQEQAMAERM
jgi:hypothetical protein